MFIYMSDENTNVLLDQHMHCVNLTLSVPNPNFGQQPQAHVRPPGNSNTVLVQVLCYI